MENILWGCCRKLWPKIGLLRNLGHITSEAKLVRPTIYTQTNKIPLEHFIAAQSQIQTRTTTSSRQPPLPPPQIQFGNGELGRTLIFLNIRHPFLHRQRPSSPMASVFLNSHSRSLFSASLLCLFIHSQRYSQRDPKDKGYPSSKNPKGKTTGVLAEMCSHLRARSTLQKRHALYSSVAPSGTPIPPPLTFPFCGNGFGK